MHQQYEQGTKKLIFTQTTYPRKTVALDV